MDRRLAPLLLILPSLLFAFWIIGYPIFDVTRTSIHDVNRFGQVKEFVGLANYTKLLADPIFQGSFWRTLIWTGGVVAGTVLLSVPIALMLNDDFYGRGLARIIIMLPWAISLTMTAVVWRWALDAQHGMLNATLYRLHLLSQPTKAWLATAGIAFPVEIAIGILVSIPFTVTIFLGGLSSLPGDIYEAARLDGATAWQRFRGLTLPLLKPFINIALVLEHHLRLQQLPDHLGADPGRSREQHGHPGHLPLQARLPLREDRRGGGDVARHVRSASRLHHRLRDPGDARPGGRAMTPRPAAAMHNVSRPFQRSRTMAQILVRDLDERVVARLKERAKASHRSLQGEVRAILEREVRSRMTPEEMEHMIEKWQSHWQKLGKTFSDSTEMIREDRDTR